MEKLSKIFGGGKVRPITPERAQELVNRGASPMHPALSRVQRDNVVSVDFKQRKLNG